MRSVVNENGSKDCSNNVNSVLCTLYNTEIK